MALHRSITSMTVKKGHKVVGVHYLWHVGNSYGSKRLDRVPSWKSEKVIPGRGDIHVHCIQVTGDESVSYQIWVNVEVDGKSCWEIAKQGFNHPGVPGHSVNLSGYQLLCDGHPEKPKWVKAVTVARHNREKKGAQLRLVEHRNIPEPEPETETKAENPTLFRWDDKTCNFVTPKRLPASSPRTRPSRRQSPVSVEDQSAEDTSESEFQEIRIVVPRGMPLRSFLRGFSEL